MKRILIASLLAIVTLAVHAEAADKLAILVAHYGSSVAETRQKTIDVLYEEIKAANPDAEVREAYIADAVRSKLSKQGLHKDSPTDALLRLYLEGYRRVIVQPTLLLDGTEMAELRRQVEGIRSLFGEITLSTPLLYTLEDFSALIPALTASAPKSKGGIVLVGHGNPYSSTGTYCMLEDMLREAGHDRFFVSTIEGYPTASSTLRWLKKAKLKSVTLVPLLLVCGNHTLQDVNGEFRHTLEEAGIEVDILLRGLAEVPEVRQLYLNKVTEARKRILVVQSY